MLFVFELLVLLLLDGWMCVSVCVLTRVQCWAADKTSRPTFVELLQRFPAVLADCAIFDENGRKFWKAHFIDSEEGLLKKVMWEDFREAFHEDFYGENIPAEMEMAQCLRALFDEKGYVEVGAFGRILGFLGPLR